MRDGRGGRRLHLSTSSTGWTTRRRRPLRGHRARTHAPRQAAGGGRRFRRAVRARCSWRRPETFEYAGTRLPRATSPAGPVHGGARRVHGAGRQPLHQPVAALSGHGPVEQNVVRWLCDLFDIPGTARGLLTSGGSMANFSARCVGTPRWGGLPGRHLLRREQVPRQGVSEERPTSPASPGGTSAGPDSTRSSDGRGCAPRHGGGRSCAPASVRSWWCRRRELTNTGRSMLDDVARRRGRFRHVDARRCGIRRLLPA
jgi:hypothetical protein